MFAWPSSFIGVHKAKNGPKAKMPKAKEPVTKGHAGTWYKAYACQNRVQYGIWGALTELRQALLPIDFASCDHTFT